mmetsp:Transcript_36209/g.88458  ORF Transcript_36209/g.88458 Transcript_36209/m.88458 type:complete len:213 (-) Transcript_36209:1008-1646(-)
MDVGFVSGIVPGRARTPRRRALCVAQAATEESATAPTAAAKRALLLALESASLGRATMQKPEQQQSIEEYIRKVEALNPTAEPLASPDLSGKWRLVYTDSEEILRTNAPMPWMQPTDDIFQVIDASAGTVRNEETLELPLFSWKLQNKVRATFETDPPRRVNVKFRQFEVGPLKFKAPETARGFLDITYLDDEMRISRGNKSSVFVLTKESK